MEILELKSTTAEIKINWMDLREQEGYCRRKGPMNYKTDKQKLYKLKRRKIGDRENRAVGTGRTELQ